MNSFRQTAFAGCLFFVSLSPCAIISRVAMAAGFIPFNAQDTAAIPKTLSQSGIFQDIVGKTVNQDVHRFEINTMLWSDGADKVRYFILPADSQITYREDSAYSFPKGTVLVKNFLIDTIQGNPSSRIYLETRLLVKQNGDDSATQWYGFSYRWRRDQSDADLVDPQLGSEVTIPTYTSSLQPFAKKWSFPSQSACWRCHMSGGRQVLGFYTAELNRPSPGNPSLNQLQAFVQAGIFKGDSFPDFSKSHHWAALTDTSASLERRARSYLAVNCSFCHGAEGRRVIGTVLSATQDLDYFRPNMPINYVNQAAKFDYGIPDSRLIYGSSPEKSIILYRMKNRSVDKMPPLATAEPDTLALRVIGEWVRTLPGPDGASMHLAHQSRRPVATLRGNLLIFDAKTSKSNELGVFDSRGQKLVLEKMGSGIYRLPNHSGVLWIRVPGIKPMMLVQGL